MDTTKAIISTFSRKVDPGTARCWDLDIYTSDVDSDFLPKRIRHGTYLITHILHLITGS